MKLGVKQILLRVAVLAAAITTVVLQVRLKARGVRPRFLRHGCGTAKRRTFAASGRFATRRT